MRCVSTGIFLRCAALCYSSSWAAREELGLLGLPPEWRIQITVNASFKQKFKMLHWFIFVKLWKNSTFSSLQCGITFPLFSITFVPLSLLLFDECPFWQGKTAWFWIMHSFLYDIVWGETYCDFGSAIILPNICEHFLSPLGSRSLLIHGDETGYFRIKIQGKLSTCQL